MREYNYGGEVAECLNGEFELLLLSTVEQDFVHDTVYIELAKGVVSAASSVRIAKSIKKTITDKGIEVVILACTKLSILKLNKLITTVPVLDSTSIHACLEFITQDYKILSKYPFLDRAPISSGSLLLLKLIKALIHTR